MVVVVVVEEGERILNVTRSPRPTSDTRETQPYTATCGSRIDRSPRVVADMNVAANNAIAEWRAVSRPSLCRARSEGRRRKDRSVVA